MAPDFEKTFIQCIVFNYNVLKELGDEASVKAAGKVLTKGKDYVVEDGDIVSGPPNTTRDCNTNGRQILIKAGAAKS